MFIQLKNHKAHIYEHNKSEDLSSNIFIIHGAGMDHRISSMIEIFKFLCRKVLCFLVSLSLGRAPERDDYPHPQGVLPVWEPPAAHVWLYLVLLVAILAHLATNMSQHTPKITRNGAKIAQHSST